MNNISIEWDRPLRLEAARDNELIYTLDLDTVSNNSGVYIFGRVHGSKLEALYVGKANCIRQRIKGHLNNLRLMRHVKKASNGRRILLVGNILMRQGQRKDKCLRLAERILLRHFLTEGHNLVNKQGTKIQRHRVESTGKHPKRWFPRELYAEKSRGE